ncbi:hypothetical protein [Streptomyces sp. CS62]|uniref:hypothetical protein n=1 Tax=Streptomyces sp. CS62 TaxID=3119268 RepID=UPI002F92F259
MLSQFCDEWRLRRGVVLRWARAWYLQRGITDLLAALQQFPPLHGHLRYVLLGWPRHVRRGGAGC